MRPTQAAFTVLATAALFGVAPLACDAKTPPPPAHAQKAAPDGYVLVEEDLVLMTADQPQAHFLAAERDLAQKDPKGAAAELRIAAGYMDMQADRGQGEDQQKVTEAADGLRKLAGELHEGSADDTAAMRQCFAKAEVAMATHFQGKAAAELSRGKPVMAGHDLQAAADALDGGLAWSGRQPPAAEVKAVADARDLAARLILPGADEAPAKGGRAQMASDKQGGEADVPKDAPETVQTLGTTIGSCAQQIESAKA